MANRSISTLVLLGIFFAVAFGWRTFVHRRRTGASGFHGISGRPGSPEWLGGVLFVLALALAAAAPLCSLAGLTRIFASPPSMAIAGLVLYGLGLAGTVWSQAAMGASWRIGVEPGERTELIRGGPFRWLRNPIFTFLMLAAAGLALLLPTILSLAAVALLLAAVELQVRFVEEPHLARVHGEPYRRYCREVGRFLPGIGRAT
jgi:protein-S-isoprenylcysteine O-methyltransferase Ste14